MDYPYNMGFEMWQGPIDLVISGGIITSSPSLIYWSSDYSETMMAPIGLGWPLGGTADVLTGGTTALRLYKAYGDDKFGVITKTIGAYLHRGQTVVLKGRFYGITSASVTGYLRLRADGTGAIDKNALAPSDGDTAAWNDTASATGIIPADATYIKISVVMWSSSSSQVSTLWDNLTLTGLIAEKAAPSGGYAPPSTLVLTPALTSELAPDDESRERAGSSGYYLRYPFGLAHYGYGKGGRGIPPVV